MEKLIYKIIQKGTLILESGLHIGDSKESADIGGVDSPVVRRKDNNEPYIPGSSLKGKIRSLLEVASGENANSKFQNYNTDIGKLFGAAGDNGRPSRILVRDAYIQAASAKKLRESNYTDMPYTEIKFENVINRIDGKAEHPRQQERVPAGTIFNIEFVINIMAKDANEANQLKDKYLKLLKTGIDLLEKDYLGGSGSRGYGQVKIALEKEEVIDIDALIKQ